MDRNRAMNFMKKQFVKLLASMAVIFITSNACAFDLIDIYNQAALSDPQFKAANAQWLANREILPITRATLFPQLSASGTLSRTRSDSETATSSSKNFNNNVGYGLILTQSVFDFANWASVWGAQALVKQAEATFASATIDLMLRTANAYFAVLNANDTLRYTQANKEALKKQLDQAQHRYDVGLSAITDLENAKASYDQAVAEEIAEQNILSSQLEKLTEITGVKYSSVALLDTLAIDLPLLKPEPADIEKWVSTAEQQNPDLAAARFGALSARENIKVKNAGHLPTIQAGGSYNYSYDDNAGLGGSFHRGKSASAGLSLDIPLFSGGSVTAQATQASYLYQQAVAQQDQTHRAVVSETRQAYLGVISGISKIEADKQAVKSTASSLRASEASYAAGTRTMVDVLTAQSAYYNAQKNYSQDQYTYIAQTLNLKKWAGILTPVDLQKINRWLRHTFRARVRTNMPTNKDMPTNNNSSVTTTAPVNNEMVNKRMSMRQTATITKKEPITIVQTDALQMETT